MPAIRHLNCPQCGGTLGAHGMERIVSCRYCRTRSLVEGDGLVPEYWVRPKLDQNSARRAVQKLLTSPGLPQGLLKLARFHSARLYFVPFHEVSARRTGTMIVTVTKETLRPLTPDREDQALSPTAFLAMQRYDREQMNQTHGKNKDTRVVMSDVTRLEPAIDLPGWNLSEAELGSLRTSADGSLQPINRREMEKLGSIHHATLTPENIIAQLELRAGTANLEDHTEFGEVRAKRIYYPVWRVRYQYQGRLYGAALDGVTGKVMEARAPQDDRSRVFWLLAMTATACLVPGKMIGAVASSVLSNSRVLDGLLELVFRLPELIVPVFIFGLAVVVVIMGVGWEEFRYPGEVIIRGDRREVEKVNRPEHTPFDKVRDVLFKVIDDWFKQAARNRRDWQ